MKKRIYSLGAVVYDHLINIESIPKKPIKVKGSEYTARLGGPAAVASIFLSSHGIDTKFIGRLGDDSDSLFLKKSLKNFKVDYKYSLVLKNTSAHKSFVVQDYRGERLIISYKPSSYDKSKIIFDKKINFSGIFLADLTWVNAAYELCRLVYKNKGKLIIDADLFIKNKKSDYIIKYSSHVIFSKVGVENYTKKKSIKDSLNFLYRKNNKFYAVTDGSKGVTWIDNGIIKKISAIKVLVKETNGAGDIFHGAFAYGLLNNFSNYDSLKYANIAAAIKCTKKGGVNNLPTKKEINKYF